MSNSIPSDRKYTKDHEWAREEGDLIEVGISDHAQSALGDIVFIELPKVGTKVFLGKNFGSVESVKAVSDLFAPVSGEVVEVNDSLSASPEIINSDPYIRGWMIKVRVSDGAELKQLMNCEDYRMLVEHK